MEGEKNKENGSYDRYFLQKYDTLCIMDNGAVVFGGWMESSGAPVRVSRPLTVWTRTRTRVTLDQDHPQHTIKLSRLSVNTNNERRHTAAAPGYISYFVRDSSFLNLLTTTVIEQVKWFPSLTILMESAGWELRLSYLQLQGHFAIYLHLHFTVPRVMF